MLSWSDMIVCDALTPNLARKRQIDGIDGDGDGCVLKRLGAGWSIVKSSLRNWVKVNK